MGTNLYFHCALFLTRRDEEQPQQATVFQPAPRLFGKAIASGLNDVLQSIVLYSYYIIDLP